MTYDAEGKYPVSPVLMPRGTMESQFEIPGGWLQPGKNYYWQVREGSNREPRSRMFQFSTSAQISGASSVADWNRY